MLLVLDNYDSFTFNLVQYLGELAADHPITEDLRANTMRTVRISALNVPLVQVLAAVAIAAVITLPLGILSGVYLTEIRGRLTFLVRFVVQSMSGVPSIVAGLFIYTTFVNYTNSFSGLAGSLALAVLMLPTVARTAEEVMKLVPDDLRSASYALGARQWRTSLMVILPLPALRNTRAVAVLRRPVP